MEVAGNLNIGCQAGSGVTTGLSSQFSSVNIGGSYTFSNCFGAPLNVLEGDLNIGRDWYNINVSCNAGELLSLLSFSLLSRSRTLAFSLLSLFLSLSFSLFSLFLSLFLSLSPSLSLALSFSLFSLSRTLSIFSLCLSRKLTEQIQLVMWKRRKSS